MSIQHVALVLDFAPDHWNTGTRMTAIALADRVGQDGTCWPSVQDLAARTGLSDRQVMRHLAYLEAEGVIRREIRRRPNGSRRSNLWIWLWTITRQDGSNMTSTSPSNLTPTTPWS